MLDDKALAERAIGWLAGVLPEADNLLYYEFSVTGKGAAVSFKTFVCLYEDAVKGCGSPMFDYLSPTREQINAIIASRTFEPAFLEDQQRQITQRFGLLTPEAGWRRALDFVQPLNLPVAMFMFGESDEGLVTYMRVVDPLRADFALQRFKTLMGIG